MSCKNGAGIIACGPDGVYRRRVMECPSCKRRHRFVVSWDGAWYGTTEYGSCGDTWQEGRRSERPFRRGWRKQRQERFRSLWAASTTPTLWDAYSSADIEAACAHTDEQALDAYRRRDEALRQIRATDSGRDGTAT